MKGLGATASYEEVFADYGAGAQGKGGAGKPKPGAGGDSKGGGKSSTGAGSGSGIKQKAEALFNYTSTINNALVEQLMKEARDINCKRLPASGTFLLRNIIEAILKHIIEDQKANPNGNSLDLETSINICLSNKVKLNQDHQKVLRQFKKDHLNHLNLGAHGNVIPNMTRLFSARDCIDQFVKCPSGDFVSQTNRLGAVAS